VDCSFCFGPRRLIYLSLLPLSLIYSGCRHEAEIVEAFQTILHMIATADPLSSEGHRVVIQAQEKLLQHSDRIHSILAQADSGYEMLIHHFERSLSDHQVAIDELKSLEVALPK